MPFEKLPPEWRHGDDGSAPLLISTLHEAALIGILPDGKARARRPPRVDDFGVGSRLRADPFQKIENQGVDGVGHGVLRCCDCVIGDWQRVRIELRLANGSMLTCAAQRPACIS